MLLEPEDPSSVPRTQGKVGEEKGLSKDFFWFTYTFHGICLLILTCISYTHTYIHIDRHTQKHIYPHTIIIIIILKNKLVSKPPPCAHRSTGIFSCNCYNYSIVL